MAPDDRTPAAAHALLKQLARAIRTAPRGADPTFCALSGLRLGLALAAHQPETAAWLYDEQARHVAMYQGWTVEQARERDREAMATVTIPGGRRITRQEGMTMDRTYAQALAALRGRLDELDTRPDDELAAISAQATRVADGIEARGDVRSIRVMCALTRVAERASQVLLQRAARSALPEYPKAPATCPHCGMRPINNWRCLHCGRSLYTTPAPPGPATEPSQYPFGCPPEELPW